jgi:signal transduction histidine kinase
VAGDRARTTQRRLAIAFAAVLTLEALVAVGCAVAVGWSFDEAVESFAVSNTVIGLSFGLCGVVIAWHRPPHPVGWLYAAGGVCMLASAAAPPLARLLADHGAPTAVVRLVVTAFAWSWPWHVGLVLPLSLLLLPDGRLPSPRWRPVAWAVVLTAPLFVLEIGLSPETVDGLPGGYLTLPSYDALGPLWTASEVRWAAGMLAGVAALAVRYRRGDERLRRQLLWPVTAALTLVAAVLPWAFVAGTPIAVLFTIPLLPVAITVGILRYQLLDIRLVIARGVAYALLSALVLAGYALLVVVLSGVASALLVALAALPLRTRLQRAVERLLYGERRDPWRIASHISGGLDDSLEAIRTGLRLPYVAVSVGGVAVAESGSAPMATATVDLASDGQLIVGLRAGERRLAAADDRVLRLLAVPLATALRATRLSDELQASRERLVATREEERRRLRRDLHDGLGPLLTGVAMSADAAANLAERSPAAAVALLGSVRTDSRTAITEIRRIIDDLRPPALDELGLVGALEARAARTAMRADGSPVHAVVEATPDLPQLPAAIEVAAYRIATEAMTNAVRHSDATHVVVRVGCDEALSVEIDDDGSGSEPWIAGVGIAGMHERVAELGGRCSVGPSSRGGSVRVSLPLVGP